MNTRLLYYCEYMCIGSPTSILATAVSVLNTLIFFAEPCKKKKKSRIFIFSQDKSLCTISNLAL